MNKLSWKHVLLGVGLILLSVVFFPELFFAHKILARMDLTWFQYPLRIFAAQNWRAGDWPLWNPYSRGGAPIHAEAVTGLFYPLNALFLLPIPPDFAFNCFFLLHLGLAAMFTYLLARAMKLSRAAALLAALSFGFGGVLTAQITNSILMTGLAWMPLVLCLVVKSIERRSIAWAALGGLALGLQTLTTQPQIVAYTVLLSAAYALFRMWFLIKNHEGRREVLWPGTVVAVVAVFGAGLAAMQWLPTLELWPLSIRAQGLALDQITLQSLHPLQLTQFLVPNLFGNPVVDYKGLDLFDELFAYVGLIPLFLAALAWRRRSENNVRFLFLMLLIMILLALGSYTPLYQGLQHLPGFSLFRIPGRWLGPTSLVLALLAGYGLDELRAEDRGPAAARAMLWIVGTGTLLAIGVACLVALARSDMLNWVAGHVTDPEAKQLLSAMLSRFLVQRPPPAQSWLINLVPWLANPGLTFFIQLFILLGVLAAYLKNKLRAASVTYILLGLTFLDLLASGGTTITHVEDASYWRYDQDVVRLVQDNAGLYRAYALPALSWDERKTRPEMEEQFHRTIDWLGDNTDMSTLYGVSSPLGNKPGLRLQRFEDLLARVPSRRLADMMSVKVLLTWGALPPDLAASYKEVYSQGYVHIYLNPTVLPRAYLAHKVETAPDGSAALQRLSEESFDPASTAIVEGPGQSTIAPPPPTVGITPATIRSYAPQRVVIETNSPQSGSLILTDTFYPGWRAWVDGREETIRPANYLFRSVPVPAGKHVIEFTYQADSFKTGLLIGGITAGLLVLWLGFKLYGSLSTRKMR